MKVSEVNKILKDNKMQDKDTNFKILKKTGGGSKGPKKPPKYFTDFAKQVLDFIQEQKKFNKLIVQRFDNLVKKNNLKE